MDSEWGPAAREEGRVQRYMLCLKGQVRQGSAAVPEARFLRTAFGDGRYGDAEMTFLLKKTAAKHAKYQER